MEFTPPSSLPSQFAMRAQLGEVARLGQWVDEQEAAHRLSVRTGYALRLCLEELITNIILHGHGGDCDAEIVATFSSHPGGGYELVVEDHARPFDPTTAELPPTFDLPDPAHIGGQGLRLIRAFVSRWTHEQLSGGNRVRLLLGG